MSTRRILVHNVSLKLGETDKDLHRALTRCLKVGRQRIRGVEVRKKSLDCRRGRPPRWIHSVVVETEEEVADRLLETMGARASGDPQVLGV